jgi:putative thioredoxin
VSISGGLPQQFNRAIDLSALAAKKTPPQDSVSAGGSARRDVDENSLVKEIIPGSKQVPVILVVWSPRSEESKLLVQALEALHRKHNEVSQRWSLAVLNADAQPAVAQALRVATIPTVMAIIAEQVAPLFDSMIPADQLEVVLNKVVELAAEQGVTGISNGVPNEQVIPDDPDLVIADQALEDGDFQGAITAFEKVLARKPGDPEATQGLANAKLLLRTSLADATAAQEAVLANPEDAKAQALAADFEILSGQAEAALDRLIQFISTNQGAQRDIARTHLLELFQNFAPTEPILIAARSALSKALF